MKSGHIIYSDDLDKTDLIVDHIYVGSRKGNAADDPLPHLLNVDSGAGFRLLGRRTSLNTIKMLVLKSNFNDPAWPDHLNHETGILTYFGDNQKPGRELHNTPREGNQILKNLFHGRHDNTITDYFPPIFIFGGTGTYRDMRFLGLAVPGTVGMGPDDDLVAIWRTSGINSERFQNYKATFTILDIPVITREWINDIKNGNAATSIHAPDVWLDWIKLRKYKPLASQRTIEIRDKDQQLPQKDEEKRILSQIYSRYKDNPFQFEKCAVEIAKLMIPDIRSCDLTRPYRDGGRDATGVYHIGKGQSSIEVTFALEAKCYSPSTSVGVKELSRLISRLRYRQFGIIITTSYLAKQAYEEVKSDGHPIVIISGGDIAQLMHQKIGDNNQVIKWLKLID
jgi:hypothetical protein